MATAVAALQGADPAMARVIEQLGPLKLRPRGTDHFAALARSILYQQLAGAAAAAIHGRFITAVGGSVTPEAVLAAGEVPLRGAGLSGAKAAAILDLATQVATGMLVLEGVERLTDDEIVARLVGVRGIGPWTAHMFLIFQLRRMDVWPVGDYGVRKGYAIAHGLAEAPTARELEALGDVYRPHRTVAALYCWRAVDGFAAPPGW